jgi:bifunctional non-homologous end joining protein LigD
MVIPFKTKNNNDNNIFDERQYSYNHGRIFKDENRSSEFPTTIKPMLATLIDQPFDNKEWVFEVKWDGVRAILFLHKAKGILKIVSRNGKNITHRYPEIIEAVKSLAIINCKESIILDGEIVVLNKEGQPDFQSHQRRMNVDSIKDIEKLSHKMPATYYLFDVLYIDGTNLQPLSFLERRKNLSNIITQTNNRIRISDSVNEYGINLFQKIKSMNLEGIVAKNKYGKYIQGARSTNWLKIKNINSQDCVVIGYTRGEGNRQGYFGSLLLAIYDVQEKELRFAGHTGSGFDFGQLNEIYSKLQQLKIEECPAKFIPYTNREPVWIRPELVAEVKFSGWTKEKIMRSPIFLRFREDKSPEECIMEKKMHTEEVNVSQHHRSFITNTTPLVTTRAPILTKNTDLKRSTINSFSNLDKVYWPKTLEHPELTKGDLIEYYNKLSNYILPHLKDRPLSLSRYPDGIAGKHFFHKNWRDQEKPEFVNTVQVYSKSTGKINNHLVCNNKDTLLWIANLGCIEMHPWYSGIKDYNACKDVAAGYPSYSSRATTILNEKKCGLNYPDFIVFDLDPYIYSDKKEEEGKRDEENKAVVEPAYNINSFKATVEVAYDLKDLLDMLNINSYVKTSGKTGLHIFVPIKNLYSFDQTRRFAETIGKMLVRRYPQKVTMKWDTDQRKGKVFFDYNQNSIGKTIACFFSVRPTTSATVSMPIRWEELHTILPTDFTMLNAFEAVKKPGGNPWKDILENKQDLDKILGKRQDNNK